MAATGGRVVFSGPSVENVAEHAHNERLKDPDEFYSYQLGRNGWNLLIRKKSEQDTKKSKKDSD